MANIRVRQVEEKATTELLRVPVDADAFGLGAAKATQGIADGLASVGGQLSTLATEQAAVLDDQGAKNAVANFDYTQRDLQRKQQAPANGEGFYDATKNDYGKSVTDYLNGLSLSPKARRAAEQSLMARQPNVLASASQFEMTQKVGYAKTQADAALGTVENRVRANPAEFDQALIDSHAVIDSRSEIPASAREAMKTAQTQTLSKRAFESRIYNAQTPEEMDGIVKELEATDLWKKRMAPADYDRILDGAKSGRSALNTKVDTEARAALDAVKDRNNSRELLDPSELAAVEASVKKSKNPGLQWQLAELKEQQAIYRQFKGLTPEQYRQKIEEQRGRQVAAGLPTEVASAINEATGKTGIPATYLAGMFNKEYGAGLYAAQGSGAGNTAGASSAVGIAQFTRETAVLTAKGGDGFNARLMGIDIAGKSDDQIHAMFKDPKVAMIGAALLARSNANAIQREIGRPPSDGELYMAHFLGSGGATTILRAVQTNPNASAAELLPKAAAANRTVFYDKEGNPYSATQLYARVTSMFQGGPSRVGEVRASALQGLYDQQQKALKDDMISYGSSSGRFVVNQLGDAASFAERGKTAMAMADYFGIARQDAQPFTKGETEALTQTIKNGSADDVLNVLQQVQAMGGDMARAAAKQLGQTDSVFGFAAGLAADRGARDVAGDIIRGQKRIEADKDIKQAVGDDKVVTQQFNSVMGKALIGVDPKTAQSIKDAALAHYVETHVARGSGKFGAFDKNAYQASLNAVMSGSRTTPAVDSVNGEPTVLPQGVSGREFDRALDSFTTDDYVRLSKDGKPPRYADGSIAKAEDIAVEGKFRAVGGGEYVIEMSNGQFLVSDIRQDRTATPYKFKASPDEIKRMASKPPANQAAPAPAPGSDQLPIMQPGGALPNYDPVTGRWLGPRK